MFYLAQYSLNIMATYTIKINNEMYIFLHTKSLKSGMYFTLTAHINFQKPHFKDSVATCS